VDLDVDLAVAGSGAGGLAAAVTAAAHGLRVALVEAAPVLGGTTAWSGGWIWAPGNPVCARAGTPPDPDGARAYLAAVAGNHLDAGRVDAFLHAAPRMIGFLEDRAGLAFEPGSAIPDTYGHLPGAGMGGRSVIARPFDARRLGPALALLRPPLATTSFHGMTIQSGADLRAFLTMTRSARSLAHVAGRVLRHGRDLALHGRGMDLRNGQALVARLMHAAFDLGVTLLPATPAEALLVEDGCVRGLRTSGGLIRARAGVVLACGGDPHASPGTRTLAVTTAQGAGLRLAQAAGAVAGPVPASDDALCPVSVVPAKGAEPEALFPHIIDRGKPGVIGVLADGRRFCNEGLGYHDYVTALRTVVPPGQPVRSWLVCDHRFLRRYGLGIVRPAPVPWRGWQRRGYLTTADTPQALARACGIDPAGLAETLARWNETAVRGEDPDFGRGSTVYMRLQGDPDQRPNPCVAPILTPPFHAVEVVPGSFGRFQGLSCDGAARVLRADGTPIPGLWAAGTDAASPFGGFYPAGGINLGPALTFGYVAGCGAAGVAP
jgi:succinate dehydrogenase/fumarate reductase flavoprotein subunit